MTASSVPFRNIGIVSHLGDPSVLTPPNPGLINEFPSNRLKKPQRPSASRTTLTIEYSWFPGDLGLLEIAIHLEVGMCFTKLQL
ncbi:hypothetical protein AG1IA_06219 [Rhizoctonia solani AG-1 IA]|uniref:Uncharacterized protein n=1 Tax=Thanatephorus cucumeris (strain AG1-IA) TaxID=983506 RepID=L8WSN3_THACA|nr:hypothetical protein AG1IA_06219 [Rhizoctonia solani AG-1 IA]